MGLSPPQTQPQAPKLAAAQLGLALGPQPAPLHQASLHQASLGQGLWRLLLCLLMVLPWISPASPAPEPNTVPLLVSWACIGALMLCWPSIRPMDIARAWALAALISSAMGLVQYFGGAAAWGSWLHVTGLGEANANLRQRNQLATLSAMGVMAVLWWHSQGLKTRQALWMLALLALGNAATGSRTGLLLMLLVWALSVAWSWRQGWATQCLLPRLSPRLSPRLAGWALAVYLLGNAALPALLRAATGQGAAHAMSRMGQSDGCGSRLVLWGNVGTLIGQKPWTGWGWGELKYAHYMTDYTANHTDLLGGNPANRFCDILGNAHNLPLHLAFVWGIPVVTALGLALLAAVVWARPWAARTTQQQLAWSVLAVIGLHSLLEFPLWYGPFQMAVLLCGWLLLAPSLTNRVANLAANRVAKGVVAIRLLGALLLLGVCLVAVDYARVHQIYLPGPQRWSIWRHDALGAARSSWFFGRAGRFAELSLTPVRADNAAWVLHTSQALLHYSPEPVVIRKLIESARLLGQTDLADAHQARLLRAFPDAVKSP